MPIESPLRVHVYLETVRLLLVPFTMDDVDNVVALDGDPAAHEKSSREILGWFHFRPPPDDEQDDVELGYRLRRSAWGNDYATELSRALIDKGFHELGARRVFAYTVVVNTASRRVMEKAGVTFVHIVHREWPRYVEGDEHSETKYALTREQRPAAESETTFLCP